MANYQKMYLALFNAVTDAIDSLQKAQQVAEELYITAEQPNIMVLEKPDTGNKNKV